MSTPTPTPTPRTYAAKIKSGFAAVPDQFYEFARTLETELSTHNRSANLCLMGLFVRTACRYCLPSCRQCLLVGSFAKDVLLIAINIMAVIMFLI